MKIYGQSLTEIFAILPVPQKIVLVAGSLFILFAMAYVPYSFFSMSTKENVPGPLNIARERNVTGVLDPALAFSDNETLMAFTAVVPPATEALDFGTEIHVTKAEDDCERFFSPTRVFETKAEELMGPDGVTPVTSGIWRVETPTLIHDPADKGREWKIYAYKYFWAKSVPLARMYGFIVTKTASSLDGPWSQEEWIFSANKNNPPYPYADMITSQLNTLHPSLQNVAFYARPSALQVNNVILMTLSAFVQGSDQPDRVVLIASVDHGRSWKYLGTPLTRNMVSKIGPYTTLAGATLIEDKSAIYLSAVLGDAAVAGLGAFLMPFDDVLKGTLRQDAKTGAPLVSKHINRLSQSPTATGGGFAGYARTCGGGIFTSELSGLTGGYEIFKSYQAPASKH